MRKNLTRKERIKNKKNILRIFSSQSWRVNYRGARLKFIENGLDYNRFMVCLVRKYGNAVERNKTKRIFREIYRKNKSIIKPGFDLAFIILPGDYEYKDREKQFKKLIIKAKLISEHK